ncbi:MAG: contractile injection system protein, VgrG/Pvc8 family [Burkholderiales bacterium]
MGNTAAGDFDVLVDAKEVSDGDVVGFVVDRDLDQPGMCVLTLRNLRHGQNNKFKLGAAVEVKVGGGSRQSSDGSNDGTKATIFKGELVGMEPGYTQDGKSEFSLRAFDKLHRLQRGRKSKSYQNQTDQDIASAIAGSHGLSAQSGATPKITHNHVYQHNQTDLEFLRMRAARLGYSVWCEDTKLYFDAPKLDAESGLHFIYGGEGEDRLKLTSFSGRMSNALVVKKVIVRGWDPDREKEIVGEANAKRSPLGSSIAASSLSDFDDVTTFAVDYPIFSVEEANAIAKAKLTELAMSFLTAESEAMGNNRVKPGIVIRITVNETNATDRFNGKYLVQGCTHRLLVGSGGGFRTIMRLVRDAERGS